MLAITRVGALRRIRDLVKELAAELEAILDRNL
jgi:hypothetical protein